MAGQEEMAYMKPDRMGDITVPTPEEAGIEAEKQAEVELGGIGGCPDIATEMTLRRKDDAERTQYAQNKYGQELARAAVIGGEQGQRLFEEIVSKVQQEIPRKSM